MNEEKKSTGKKIPVPYSPTDCELMTVANYARKANCTTVWVYQMYQEDKIDLVSLDGKIYVKL